MTPDLATLAILTYPNIDPVIFQVGPVAVHWYGLAYVAGILCGWLYGRALVANKALWPNGISPMEPVDIDDFVLWITGGIILGGRIGYILFYDLARTVENPLSVFAVWEGGMSFHGGLIGVVVAIVGFTWRYRIPLLSLIDVVAASVPFGLFFGRIANFINGELWGAPSTLPWAMAFPTGGPVPRHPSMLYEALLEGVVLFFVLRVLTHRYKMFKRPRFVGSVFIGGYGLARIAVEFVRMPDAHIGYLFGGWLTMGMVLSLPMVLIGLWGVLTAKPHVYAPREATAEREPATRKP